MRKNLSIYGVEETMNRDRTKTYWKVKTNQGIHSVWEDAVATDLMDSVNRICDVEIEVKGIYKNITAFNGAYGPAEVQAEPEIKPASKIRPAAKPVQEQKIPYESFEEKKQRNIAKASAIKLKSVAVAYAVQKYNAEIPALIAKAKDYTEARMYIAEREQSIAERARGFYELIKDLDKLEFQKASDVKHEEPIDAEVDDEDLDYDDMEVVKI